jgi:hypothetical protein
MTGPRYTLATTVHNAAGMAIDLLPVLDLPVGHHHVTVHEDGTVTVVPMRTGDHLTPVLDAPDIPVGASLRLERTEDGWHAVPMIEIDTRQAYGSGQYADGSVKYVHGDCIHEINESYNGRWEPRGYEIRLWVDIPEENRC